MSGWGLDTSASAFFGSMIVSLLVSVNVFAAEAPAVRTKLLTADIDLQTNGLGTATIRTELQATNAAGVSAIGQVPVPYSESLENVDIVEAYTLKASGQKIPVDTSAIFAQLPPGTGGPMITDQKMKVIVFPNVEVGDTVTFVQKRTQRQVLIPGLYALARVFPQTAALDDARITITAPKDLAFYVETHDVPFEKSVSADRAAYTWHYAVTNPVATDMAALSPWDRVPRIFASTMKGYDELGRAYALGAAPKMVATAKIQALANQITAGQTDHRQQAKAIYEWVSKHVRYVAIELGQGAVVPHDAEAILTNGYGDCKDHAALFSTLLKAKGIESESVLINLGNAYSLSGPPTFAQLNHVITWIPELNLYADTTAGLAPFGLLPLEEYGKPAVHAVATGNALRRIPVVPAGAMSVTLKTNLQLLPDGIVKGLSSASATGPFEVRLRQIGRVIQAVGSERFVQGQFHLQGSFDITPPDDFSSDYRLKGQFELPARPTSLAGAAFAPPVGMWLVSRPGGVLLGFIDQTNLPDTEATPCFSGHESEDVVLDFPADKHVAKLPEDNEIKSDHLRYATNWSTDGHTVTVHREFDTKVDQPLCTGDLRKEAAAALVKIRQDYGTQISLVPN